MECWIIVATIIIIFLMWPWVCDTMHGMLCPNKSNGYMRRPLERFASANGAVAAGGAASDPYCCRFKFSPHQYPLVPVPRDLFNTWYRLV